MVSLSGEETKNHNKNPLCFELFQPNIYGLKAFFKKVCLRFDILRKQQRKSLAAVPMCQYFNSSNGLPQIEDQEDGG